MYEVMANSFIPMLMKWIPKNVKLCVCVRVHGHAYQSAFDTCT